MEQSRLEEFNHWWIRKDVDIELALPFKRDNYLEIERSLNNKFIIALVGLRRVGKTTTIYQLIQKLIEKVPVRNVLFFSFDDLSAKLGDVIDKYREVHQIDFREEKVYVFLDEIQKCSNWENDIKRYYDLYPKLKFVISGSESIFIRKKTKETLAGRVFEFRLNTFTFREYLKFNKLNEDEFKYETKIKPLFIKYVERGGFPETFTFQSDREFREYIRSLVIDKIVYKDIPQIFNIQDTEFIRVLLELISMNPGMYIDYQSLSKQYGKDRRVIGDYISYLKDSFLITLLGNYRKGSTTIRKIKRAYPSDNALIFLYKSVIEEDFFGRMVETLAVNKSGTLSFWKNGGEIDIIKDGLPIEVKYKNKFDNKEFKPLVEFMNKFDKDKGIILTKNDERKVKVNGKEIKLIPVWKWLQDCD